VFALETTETRNIDDAIPDSSASRQADTFVEQIDRAGIPLQLAVDVFGSEPIITIDRTTKYDRLGSSRVTRLFAFASCSIPRPSRSMARRSPNSGNDQTLTCSFRSEPGRSWRAEGIRPHNLLIRSRDARIWRAGSLGISSTATAFLILSCCDCLSAESGAVVEAAGAGMVASSPPGPVQVVVSGRSRRVARVNRRLISATVSAIRPDSACSGASARSA
jgi:hypothetical protein